jgi:hypothetical protein
MAGRRREKILYVVVLLVAVAAVAVIVYKVHALGWSSGN